MLICHTLSKALFQNLWRHGTDSAYVESPVSQSQTMFGRGQQIWNIRNGLIEGNWEVSNKYF